MSGYTNFSQASRTSRLLFIFCFLSAYVGAQNTNYTPLYTSSNFIKTIDLSKSVGEIGGSASASASGGVSYTIPIYTPPGTNGIEPSVSLSYNSQAADGVVGFGWNITGLSVISRTGKNMYHNGMVQPVKYSASEDAFLLDGMRLNVISGVNGADGTIYAGEAESFAKIISVGNYFSDNPDWFKLIAKDGSVMEFGNSSNSKFLTDDLNDVIAWRLSKIIDVNGNYIEFIYSQTDRSSRIEQIKYTGNVNAGLIPYNTILFDYSLRNDQTTAFDGDASINSKYLLDRIKIIHTNDGGGVETVKTYRLNYGTDAMNSFLKEIIEFGGDETNVSLNSTIFLYGDKPVDFTTTPTTALNGTYDHFVGDFNGDGRSDVVLAAKLFNTNLNTFFHTSYSLITLDDNGYSSTLYTRILDQTTTITTPNQGKSFNFLASDFDGDGRDDLLELKSTAEEYRLVASSGACGAIGYRRKYIGNRINFTRTASPGFIFDDFPVPNDASFYYEYASEKGNFFFPGDFNGDGNQDYILILGKKRTQGSCTAPGIPGGIQQHVIDYKAFLTSPSTNEENKEILNFGVGTNPYISQHYAGTIANADKIDIVDFDGDGKKELMITIDLVTYILTIEGLSAASGYSFTAGTLYNTSSITKDSKCFTGDINGDRKTDFLVRSTATGPWNINYSTGTTLYSVPFSFNQGVLLDGTMSEHKIVLSDFNGDGKSDILHAFADNFGSGTSKMSMYYSKGNVFSNSMNYEQYAYSNSVSLEALLLGDFNGDGRSDFISRHATGGGGTSDIIKIKPKGQERLLKKVTTGFNNTTAFDYKLLTDKSSYPYFYNTTISLDDPININPYNNLQLPIFALQSFIVPDGIGGLNVTEYKYEDAIVHRHAKGFLGFKKVTSSNSASGLSTITENQLQQEFAILYNTINETQKTSTQFVISTSKTFNSFTNISSGGVDKRYYHKIDKVFQTDNLNDVASETVNTYDNFGNIIENVSKVGPLSTSPISATETTITNTTFGIHNTPVPAKADAITVINQRVGVLPITTANTFTYNSTGLLQSKIAFAGMPKAVTTSFNYGNFGNVTGETSSSVGLSNRVTNITYDPKGRYIIQKSLAPGSTISQTENFSVDSRWGSILSTTTSDCLSTVNQYDNFGKLVTTSLPDGNNVTNSNTWDVSGNHIFFNRTYYYGIKPDESNYFDRLGRVYKSEKVSLADPFGGSPKLHTALTTYDSRGNVYTQSNTFFPNEETPQISTNSYDDYNRLTSSSNYAGTGTTSYLTLGNGQTKVTSTLPSGETSSKVFDAAGKVVSSVDGGGQLNFVYDSRGNQTEVYHGSTRLINSAYDDYGRQISLEDKNAGTTTYMFNAFGELTSQTDAKGNNYNMLYDALGRLVTRTGGDGATQYEYYYNPVTGCSNNSTSKLTGANGVVYEYIYDAMSRLAEKKYSIEGSNYSTIYTYNALGQMSNIQYPSGLTVNNIYDANGYLDRVFGVAGSGIGSRRNYFRSGEVDGEGRYKKYTLLNGLMTTNTYNYDFPASTFTLGAQNLQYSFQLSTGNLLQRTDNMNGQNEVFTFDNLNRLTSSTVNGMQQFGMTYDGTSTNSLGNISTKTDVGYYTYRTNKVNAVAYTMATPGPNQSTVFPAPIPAVPTPLQQISYTPFLKTESIEENGLSISFMYGPDYERVKTTYANSLFSTESRYYLGEYEKQVTQSGTREIHYIPGGNGTCAMVVLENGSYNTYAVYTDYLGSVTALTDQLGNIVAEQNFDAWGRRRQPATWNNYYADGYAELASIPAWLFRGYTGHEMLPQFSLINMNGRMYDPILGRMLSPDNYVSTPLGTQGYNRYTYALNNPLKYVDPDGNNPIVIGAIVGAFFGGVQANNGQLNPFKWDYSSETTWKFILGGAIAGGISGGVAKGILASGIPFANTGAIIGSSLTNSIGTNIYTGGQTDISLSFGAGSYNFSRGEFGYLGKKGNSFLENLGYGLGAMANISDMGKLGSMTYNVEKNDVINHAAIKDGSKSVVSFGPGESPKYDVLTEGKTGVIQNGKHYGKMLGGIRGTNDYPIKGRDIILKNVNTTIIKGYGRTLSYLSNKGLMPYSFVYSSCSTHAGLALWFSGMPNLFIHPYTLQGSIWLWNQGITPGLIQNSFHLNR